jgi:hypothetical protein
VSSCAKSSSGGGPAKIKLIILSTVALLLDCADDMGQENVNTQ